MRRIPGTPRFRVVTQAQSPGLPNQGGEAHDLGRGRMSRRPEGQPHLSKPLAVGDRDPIRAEVQLSLKVKREPLRSLRFDDGNVLPNNPLLEPNQFLFGYLPPIVHGYAHPALALEFVQWCHAELDCILLSVALLREVHCERSPCAVRVVHVFSDASPVRVWLPDAHVSCEDSRRARLDLIVFDCRVLFVSEKTLVDEWEVADVEEVLYCAGSARPVKEGFANDLPIA